ncbi:unnamed protein product [Camellia sinensis]
MEFVACDMACSVFGNPITDETLKGLPEYEGRAITRSDRAHVARNMKNAANKDVNARQYVENLKKEWGDGVSTLCLVYNATGDTVEFITYHDYNGHVGQAPYPMHIANGQWAGFLHGKTSAEPSGSTGTVVYRGKNQHNQGCDWMLAWFNPGNRKSFNNKVYTEIREAGHYDGGKYWDYIYGLIDKSGITKKDVWGGCLSYVSTGSSTTAIFEAIMTLENA